MFDADFALCSALHNAEGFHTLEAEEVQHTHSLYIGNWASFGVCWMQRNHFICPCGKPAKSIPRRFSLHRPFSGGIGFLGTQQGK